MNIQGFKEFVADQPADRVIVHNLWEHCAVGDYIKSLPDDQTYIETTFLGRVDQFVETLRKDCYPLYTTLNHNGNHANGKVKTYGQLHDYMGTL